VFNTWNDHNKAANVIPMIDFVALATYVIILTDELHYATITLYTKN